MSNILTTTLIAAAMLVGIAANSAEAAYRTSSETGAIRTPHWIDLSKPYGGFSPDNQAGQRAFWEYLGRQHD